VSAELHGVTLKDGNFSADHLEQNINLSVTYILGLTLHQEVPKLFFQQDLRGLVDKTMAQQFECTRIRRQQQQQRHLVSNTTVSAAGPG
jgi:hypothetical protein